MQAIKYGQTMDYWRRDHRNTRVALRFWQKAIRRQGLSETITTDRRDANERVIKRDNVDHSTTITIRQIKHFNTIAEQDHRAIKGTTCPMVLFKSFEAAEQFYAVAA